MAAVGIGTGVGLVALVLYNIRYPGYEYVMRYTTDATAMVLIYVFAGISSGIIFFFISPGIIDGIGNLFVDAEKRLSETPAPDLLCCVLGIMIGLLLAFLMGLFYKVMSIPVIPKVLTILTYVVCAYFGGRIGLTRRAELMPGAFSGKDGGRVKVLDTSAIIDGRIYDIAGTGFLEGSFVVPGFVLKELRHIADSSDAVRRARGRRGLDILRAMQKDLPISVRVNDRDYDDIDEVDLKLLRLADELGGQLITTDYNLNKVAAVQHVTVLNINDLANAIRPVLMPGEELEGLTIVREGKEQGQGIGYLADGTLVIVEGGRKHIGETLPIVVTSALQTSAGRMIFAKLK